MAFNTICCPRLLTHAVCVVTFFLVLCGAPTSAALDATTQWIPAPETKGDAWFDATFQASANGIIRVDVNGAEWLYYKRL